MLSVTKRTVYNAKFSIVLSSELLYAFSELTKQRKKQELSHFCFESSIFQIHLR